MDVNNLYPSPFILLARLNFDGWSEADVREEYVMPLLIIVGL